MDKPDARVLVIRRRNGEKVAFQGNREMLAEYAQFVWRHLTGSAEPYVVPESPGDADDDAVIQIYFDRQPPSGAEVIQISFDGLPPAGDAASGGGRGEGDAA